MDHEIFELGDVVLQCGATLRDARLAYRTFGTLSAEGDNVVVLLTYMAGTHRENQWVVREGGALDPSRYFVVIPNLFGNGLSSSPSNTPPPYDRARFPLVTFHDNVRCQHRLLTERLGVERIRLVTGWSMGAGQAFEWGAQHPDMVRAICPTAGAARTARHNFVMLEGVKAALTADAAFMDGWYQTRPRRGLRAMARVYAGWGFSQEFYRREEYLRLGFSSLEDFLVAFWEQWLDPWDANDLLAMIATWQAGDIAANDRYGGDLVAALSAIEARAIVMPGRTDLYFPPEDSEFEVAHMPDAELRPFESIYGHMAGGSGLNADDLRLLEDTWRELLAD